MVPEPVTSRVPPSIWAEGVAELPDNVSVTPETFTVALLELSRSP